jgi:hypothetical protein
MLASAISISATPPWVQPDRFAAASIVSLVSVLTFSESCERFSPRRLARVGRPRRFETGAVLPFSIFYLLSLYHVSERKELASPKSYG